MYGPDVGVGRNSSSEGDPAAGRRRHGRSATAPRHRARPGFVVALLAAVALGFGMAATLAVLPDPAGRMVAGNVPDAVHYSWWLGHTPHALAAGDDPLFSTLLNWREGVGAMNNTSLLLPAVLFWPLTAAAGPLATLNLLTLLAVPACAAAGYWALRRLRVSGLDVGRPAALAGAVVFAISPAVVNSLVGHVTMALAPALPVLLALSVEAWSGPRPVRAGLLLGAVATVQVFVGEEVLFQAGAGALVLLLVAAASRPRSVGAGAVRLTRALAAAFAVFLPIAGYPLYVQFLGPLRQHGNPFLPDYYGADLLGFVVPTRTLLLRTPGTVGVANRFPGGLEEHLAYLGVPLLLTCLVVAVLGRRSLQVRCAAVGLLVFAALSLGGRLWIAGTWTQIRGPFALLQDLPLTEASLATRFGLLAAVFAGALLACAVQALLAPAPAASPGGASWPRPGPLTGRRRSGAALLTLACLGPLLPRPIGSVEAPAVPAYFAGFRARTAEPPVLLVLPYPIYTVPVAMAWQTAAGYRFRMPGGYFLGPGPGGRAYVGGGPDPETGRLLQRVVSERVAVPITDDDRVQARIDLTVWDVDAVVLGPSAASTELRKTVTDLLGVGPRRVDGVDLWTDPLSAPAMVAAGAAR